MNAILQSEASECGIACLAMVANAHGYRTTLSDLRHRFSVSLKGVTLPVLIRHAQSLGLSGRALRLELEELVDLKTPCILHWNLNHFVVLKKATASGVEILDPAVGRLRLSYEKASRHFTGVALELTPTATFKPEPEPKRIKARDLVKKVTGLKRALMQVFALAFAMEIFGLAAPIFNQFVVDEVIVTGDSELLSVLAVGFALLLITQVLTSAFRSWLVMRLSTDIKVQWTGGLFTHMVSLPVSYFEKRFIGDIVSRFGSINAIQGTLTTAAITAVIDGMMALLALGMLLLYSPLLTLIVILSITVYALLRWGFYSAFREANAERLVLSAKESSHFLETLRAISPIKLAGKEIERRARWQNLLTDVINRDIATQKFSIVFSVSSTLTGGAASLLVMYFGAKQVIDGALTVGMLMAFISYSGTLTARINSLIGYVVDLKMTSVHTERLADIALEAPEDDLEYDDEDHGRLSGQISLNNVSFRYAEGEPWILRNISMTVAAGESLAIVGPSGCGKTTLLKIILGLLDPTEGEVLIDGIPLRRLGKKTYRNLLGAVLQDDMLLAGSIADNINFFATESNQERVEACAQIAALHDEIVRMPMGYRTFVGDMGSALSGGQKQRVLLARALYKQPRILVLDEASSHLDVRNEQRINEAIKGMRLTRVVVAHRPETISSAEKVFILGGSSASDRTGERVAGERLEKRRENEGITH
jgi:ATP-binding cassette subfamily B protein RaxB